MAQKHTPEHFAVLVVEDEFLIAMELVDLLERAGYEVIGPAATVQGALRLLDDHSVQACVLDVNLRGEHSAAVALALRSRKVPFVISSAYEQATLDVDPAFDDVTNLGKPALQAQLLITLASF